MHYLDLAAEEVSRFDADMAALRPPAGVLRAEGHLGHPRHPRVHRDGARIRTRLPVRRGGVFRRVVVCLASGRSAISTGPTMLELARERGGNPDDPNKRDPLDFVLWQPSAPGRAGVGIAVGTGAARLAHRVFGPGPAGAGRDHRPAWRRLRPDLSPPRVRGGPVRGGHRSHGSSATGCTAAWSAWAASRCPSRSGNLVFVHDLLKDWEGSAIRLAVLTHHYRSDWDWHDGLMPEAADPAGPLAGRRPGAGALAEVAPGPGRRPGHAGRGAAPSMPPPPPGRGCPPPPPCSGWPEEGDPTGGCSQIVWTAFPVAIRALTGRRSPSVLRKLPI